MRADLFINHADFYPALDPAYAKLVELYTGAAWKAGATVHDGAHALGRIKMRDAMHFAAESTREVVDMYISAARSMLKVQRPPDVQQNTDESMAEPNSSDPDSSDPEEDWLPGSPPQERESAEAVRKRLLEKFNDWNNDNRVKKPVPECLRQEGQWLLPTRMPAWLSPHDKRFHVQKTAGLCLRHT